MPDDVDRRTDRLIERALGILAKKSAEKDPEFKLKAPDREKPKSPTPPPRKDIDRIRKIVKEIDKPVLHRPLPRKQSKSGGKKERP